MDLVSLGDELSLLDWKTGVETAAVLADELMDGFATSSEFARGKFTPDVSVSTPFRGTVSSCTEPIRWGSVF